MSPVNEQIPLRHHHHHWECICQDLRWNQFIRKTIHIRSDIWVQESIIPSLTSGNGEREGGGEWTIPPQGLKVSLLTPGMKRATNPSRRLKCEIRHQRWEGYYSTTRTEGVSFRYQRWGGNHFTKRTESAISDIRTEKPTNLLGGLRTSVTIRDYQEPTLRPWKLGNSLRQPSEEHNNGDGCTWWRLLRSGTLHNKLKGIDPSCSVRSGNLLNHVSLLHRLLITVIIICGYYNQHGLRS